MIHQLKYDITIETSQCGLYKHSSGKDAETDSLEKLLEDMWDTERSLPALQ